jgi:hypothetical protein
MRFKLLSLLLLFSAACLLLTAFVTLLHAGPNNHYEIAVALLGSVTGAIVLVLLIIAEERAG